MKQRIYKLFDSEADRGRSGRLLDLALIWLICLNVAAVIAESVSSLRVSYSEYFFAFEIVSVAAFSAEYLLRLWSCTEDPRYQGALVGRLRYARTPFALIDLVAILPAFLVGVPLDLRFLRVIRLVRLLRVAKLIRHSHALQTFARVAHKTRAEMALTMSLIAVLLILASSMMYLVESAAQPEAFSSIPAAMWWAVATLTTVGYGDIYPITIIGKIIGGFISILGIGLFALPTGILGAAFLEETKARNNSAPKCPSCGQPVSRKG
ncbi:MAG: ion transporter [Leptospirillia bacterium]